ncbi:MAG: PDZ domain-containing protein [Saprospiraceae bacterium]|nr:PDZ domain-containing protein [Saprospiraceae bacterium]MCB9322454.1 PDZ domain-containing protein [Lewinellaceae bacterium]
MKSFNIRLLSLILVLSLALTTTFAQNQSPSQMVIIQKVENTDGTTSTVKKIISDKAELKAALEGLGTLDAKDVNLHFVTEDTKTEDTDTDNEDMIMFIRKAKDKNAEANQEFESLKIFMSDEITNVRLDDAPIAEKEKITKPLLGVYIDESRNGDGVKLTGVVNGKGSEKAGLKSGDIITHINGQAVNNVYDLRNELNKYLPGASVNVNYSRDGQVADTQVNLSESTTWQTKRNPCKVFIGVQLGGHNFAGRGVNIDGIIPGWPAEKAGLRAGDVIVALDDAEVNTFDELLTERNKHTPGEFFTLSILREGNEIDIDGQFLVCQEEEGSPEAFVEEEDATEVDPVMEIPEDIPTTVENGPLDNEIDGALKLEAYRAFPNPTYGKVKIQFIAEEGPTTIQVVDVSGKVLYKEQLRHFDGYYNKEIDIKDGTPGTVVLYISQNGKTVYKKLVLMPRA